MKCRTFDYWRKQGDRNIAVYKDKQQFNSLDEAIISAKKFNAESDKVYKLVAYKCDVCFKYHIGRNGNLITEKERTRLNKKNSYIC